MRHILHFLAEPFFRLTCKKRLGNPPKNPLWQKLHYSDYFLWFNEVEKIIAKYTNKLQFIGILQLSQKHLKLEINFSKEIEKMIAKNFHETLICSFKCIFSIMIAFKPLCNHFLSPAIPCNHAIIVLSLHSPWFPSPEWVEFKQKLYSNSSYATFVLDNKNSSF